VEHHAKARSRGFTLIELLAVVAIAGLLLAAAAVNLFPGDAEVARREAGTLALAMESARDEAWFGGRPVAVSVAGSRMRTWRLRPDRTWEEEPAKARAFDAGLRVTSLHVEGERLAADERLVFLADGLGVPFRLAIEVRGIERAIEGDAAGGVRLLEAR
jgi:general secretion pathway protein H